MPTRRLLAVLLGIACWLPGASAQDAAPVFTPLADGTTGALSGPASPRGLILVLPDALGGDPRSQPYTGALHAAGFLTLEPQWQDVPRAMQAARTETLLRALGAFAARRGVEGGAVGVLGHGAGAAHALASPLAADRPVAALYPGCLGLLATGALPVRQSPTLLLHGSADSAEPDGACAALTARLGPEAVRHEYFGATYGWDFLPAERPNAVSLLPAPDAEGTPRRAHATPGVTADAALRVAAFFAARLGATPSRVILSADAAP